MSKYDEVEVEKEDEDTELPTESEEEKKEPFPEYEDSDPNLAMTWGDHEQGVEALKEIADTVIENHDDAYDATEEYRKKMSDNWKIFTGDLPKKHFPYEDCANGHVPMMIENITRLSFRAFSELFSDWHNVFGAEPIGPAAQEEAELVTLHSNWQLREQIPDFKRQMHRGVLGFFVVGDLTCHSYYNMESKQNRHEFLTPDEFAVPFTYTSTQPNYSDCPYYSKIMNLYRHSIEARLDVWAKVDEVLDREASFEDDPQQTLSKDTAQSQGVDEVEVAPYKLIWYEGWLELPNQDRDRWCRVIVDYKTKAVMELLILEEPNWQDVERFRAQEAELQSYQMELQNHTSMLEQQKLEISTVAQQALDAGEQMGPEQKMAIATSLQEAAQIQPPPPVAPTWMKKPDDLEETPEPPRYEPIHLFTHFVCIEPLVGTLGLGWGRIQGDMNRAANTMLNQWIDAATLSNVWTLIVSDQLQFTEKVEWRPGTIAKVRGMSGTEIKENIMELKASPPAGELIQGVNMVRSWASESMQAPSVLSGETGKSGESAKLQASRVEQATKQLSVTTRKFADSLEYVAKANAALNRVHMPDEEIMSVARARGGIKEEFAVGRALYDRGYRFSITADLRFTSRTVRIQEADELVMMTKEFPQLQQNLPFMFELAKKALEAREQWDLLPFLGPAPPPPQTTFGMPPPAPPAPPGQPGAPGAPGAPPPPPPGNNAQQGPQQPPQPSAPQQPPRSPGPR
jgi:hypothetical protein